VKAAYGVTIDFAQFAPGDRVKISGREMTKKREYDGRILYDLICKADTIEKVVNNNFNGNERVANFPPVAPAFPEPDGDAPF
jgi:hypothetical protein